MPKVKTIADIEKQKDLQFKIVFNKYMIISGLKQVEIAKRIGIHPKTLSTKVNDPKSFTLGEIRRLAAVLDIDTEELAQAI